MSLSIPRNAYFQSPCNLGSELESAMEDSYEAGLPSLVEEEDAEVGPELYIGSPGLGHNTPAFGDRSRKNTLFDKTGSRFLDSAHRSPFRHSYVDVRLRVLKSLFFIRIKCLIK